MQPKLHFLRNIFLKKKSIIFLGLLFSFPLLFFLSAEVLAASVNVWTDCSGTQAYYHYTYSRPNDGATWKYNITNSVGMNLTLNAWTSGSGNGGSNAGVVWTVKLLRSGAVQAQDSATAPDCSIPDPVAECGNGICESGESYSTCPGDCPDISPPAVIITSPSGGATVFGTVTLVAFAADPQSGVSQVKFLVQSIPSGSTNTICTDFSFPYSCSWNTNDFADGGYRVYAEAKNGAGLTWSRYVTVSVANAGPTCDCTSWTGHGCGGVGCSTDHLGYTRSCTPPGCDDELICNLDVTCLPSCVCDPWVNQGCGEGDCSLDKRLQTRACDPSGCEAEHKCLPDPICAAPGVSRPTISPSCLNSTSKATISWTGGDGSQGFWVDIDNDTNWGNGFWNKNVSLRSTTAPDGFNPGFGASGSLTLNSGSTYYVRIYDPVLAQHSPAASFVAQNCAAPICDCDSWVDHGCGGAGCPVDQRGRTRSCNPPDCKEEHECISDPVCVPSPGKKELNVHPYIQFDYPNDFFVKHPDTGARTPAYQAGCETSHTIRNSGCVPTSVAMILDYYGKNKGAVGTANIFTDHGCVSIWGNCSDPSRPYGVYRGSAWPKSPDPPNWPAGENCRGVIESMSSNIESLSVETFSDIAFYIDLDYPVLLAVKGGGGCYSCNHAMVAKGYKKDDQGNVEKIYTNDPAGAWGEFIAPPSCIAAASVILP